MSAIGSLVFCDDCNNLLTRNNTANHTLLDCEVCGAQCEDTAEKSITTQSKPDAFPSSLWAKKGVVQQPTGDETRQDTIVREMCAKCEVERDVAYYTQQLRSADEGSTVFYTCQTCGDKWNVNN